MRLGAPVDAARGPEAWAVAHQAAGYGAAYWPLAADAPSDERAAFMRAADAADLVIAEVGAWSNPISPDESIRRAAVAHCQTQLALADEVGARCCVNISGSRATQWDGPDADNLTEATFNLIVETVRHILDAVRPKRSFYALEMMPWAFPDSAESALALVRAIDRPGFGLHLDPVNLITSPRQFYNNARLIEDCCITLGPLIKSCHAKDIVLQPQLTVHLDEVRPGLGGLDYAAYLRSLAKLGDIPLMLEHLSPEEYGPAGAYIRATAEALGMAL
ncbi:MAG TPA: TIM barrel protein [Candidatus Limnocylindrales bacterium]|nr:TIM barrel protein [Candidatus Limnocylindrales bacterium]